MSCALGFASEPSPTEDLFPTTLQASQYTGPKRPWSIADIVEVTRIKGIAIQGKTKNTAFILERPSVADGKNHFALYMVDPDQPGPAHKLVDADYMADLAWRPGTTNWTVRADRGEGVQLYEISADGSARVLLSNDEVVVIGGSYGLQISGTEGPRLTGIISYEWAPDGHAFWYSRIRLRPEPAQLQIANHGVVFNDTTASGPMEHDIDRELRLQGTELHVVDVTTGSDRIVAFSPRDESDDFDVFRCEAGSTGWADATDIQYRLRIKRDGLLIYSLRRVDVRNGAEIELADKSTEEIWYSNPTAGGLMTTRKLGDKTHLLEINSNSEIVRDYGAVDFLRVGGGNRMWRRPNGSQMVFEVERDDRDALVSVPSNKVWNKLSEIPDFLSSCAFNIDLTYGACARENMTLAPELVAIRPSTPALQILARPNRRYDEIMSLKSEKAHWTNKYGLSNTGYITYPRDYQIGRKYPVLLISHGWDAKNVFARDSLQWEFPIQVFAERGYFILSVNETRDVISTPPAFPAASQAGTAKEQFSQGYCPLATMEAAARALIDAGLANASEIGIAGYSKGATVSRFVMAHSTVFAAGSSAESSWWDAGGFAAGSALSRKAYTNLLGGSPFDAAAHANYVAFAPSARADHFAGPLLQQFTDASAQSAVEMDQMLKQAGVPTELVVFPAEAHYFWQPRHRASAMEQNRDWFDFWLQGIEDPDPAKTEQYDRWRAMRSAWHASHAEKDVLVH
jgi:dipeptidyl aminopeptidase/acylaminoacyl peptidase